MKDTQTELLEDFLSESCERIDRVEYILISLPIEPKSNCPTLLRQVQMELHTLKGNSGMMGFETLQTLAHELEDQVEWADPDDPPVEPLLAGLDRFRGLLDELRPTPSAREKRLDQSRVPVAAQNLDFLAESVSETLIARNRLVDSLARGGSLDPLEPDYPEESDHAWKAAEEALHGLSRHLGSIQEQVLAMRTLPLTSVYSRLSRIVHDEAKNGDKKVRLETDGGDTSIDRSLAEFAADALGHLVRNAVVHGIESPTERQEKDKPSFGTVRVQAALGGSMIEMDVIDDGRGVDRKELKKAAKRFGFDTERLDDLHSLVFLPGLSTRIKADLGAGRGVGLAAVRDGAQRLGGSIELVSVEGQGSHFRLRLPTHVSIMQALIIRVGNEQYALPASPIVESIALDTAPTDSDLAQDRMTWRGRSLDLLDMGRGLGADNDSLEHRYVVVIAAEGRLRGLLVDDLMGLQEILVKKLDGVIGAPAGIAGSTILGDGRVVMILDAADLATMSAPPTQPS